VKVVFDTNVVASAIFRRGAPFDRLSRWADGRCEAVVSPELLAEYHEPIEELRLEHPSHKYVDWAAALSEAATLVFPTERTEGATPDPGDEMILECGVAAEAQPIATGDKRHLHPPGRFREIIIITPAEFLRKMPVQGGRASPRHRGFGARRFLRRWFRPLPGDASLPAGPTCLRG